MTIHVSAIIGSTSLDSNNLKVVEFLQKKYAGEMQITPIRVGDLEMFSVDRENDPSEKVTSFMEEIREADAVLFATPEYNFSIPGAMKNALDWLSRSRYALKDKPSFIIGASTGVLGSVKAQLHLRQILANPMLSPALLPNNEVYIGKVLDKLSDDGELIDADTIAFLDKVIQNFLAFYEKQKR